MAREKLVRPKNYEILQNLEGKFDSLTSKLDNLTDLSVKTLELVSSSAKLDQKLSQLPTVLEFPIQNPINTTSSNLKDITTSYTTPVPLEYRQLVDNTLNRSFEIEVLPRTDIPAFEFAILVPKKYSNAPQTHWDMYQSDRRSKVISYAEGINGVREWCERVFSNFNQEIKSSIVMDRVQAQ